MCPYADSKQKGKHGGGSTDLGSWEGWADDYTTMEFKNGQACWNGPIRSLKVHLILTLSPSLTLTLTLTLTRTLTLTLTRALTLTLTLTLALTLT